MTEPKTYSRASLTLRNGLIAIIGFFILIFMTGILAGYLSEVIENKEIFGVDIVIIPVILFLLAGIVLSMIKLWRVQAVEPIAKSTKKARYWISVGLAFGVALGIFFAIIGGGGPDKLLSNQPVSPTLAIVGIAIWLTVVPFGTWAWWRSVDEHEATAYRDGAMVAAHAYLFIAPTWWLAARAGWVQTQDPMIILLIVSAIWSAFWLYRKYT